MIESLEVNINIFLKDGFREAVMRWAERESVNDIRTEDIIEYLNVNITPAKSDNKYFMVEGGDTDGWFIQGINNRLY